MTRFDSSQAVVCSHCGAPLAVLSNKIEQCDYCNSHNELKSTKDIFFHKKAQESRESILVLLGKNNAPATRADIFHRISSDIDREDLGLFKKYFDSCLDELVTDGKVKVARGRFGGYQIMVLGRSFPFIKQS